MPVADNDGKKQLAEPMMCLKPVWSDSVYIRCHALLRTLLVLQCDVVLQFKQHSCRRLLTAFDMRESFGELVHQHECLSAEFAEQLAVCVEGRNMVEAAFERFTEIRKSIHDQDADVELSEMEQEFRSQFDELDKMSISISERCSHLDQAKVKGFRESFQTEIDFFLQSFGTDKETLQLDQTDLQAQIDSLRESVSKALQSFLQDPEASLVDDLWNLPLPIMAVPEEAPEVDLSACIATQYNKFFGKEQFGFELHVAQEYVQLSHAIVNDLIYVLECRKPIDVTVSVFDSERLRQTVRSVQPFLGTTIDRADANEFGHLMQEVISDYVRLFRHHREQSANAAEFAKSLSINLDTIGRENLSIRAEGRRFECSQIDTGKLGLVDRACGSGGTRHHRKTTG